MEKEQKYMLLCPECAGVAFNVLATGYGAGTVRCVNCKVELVLEECPKVKEAE